MRFLPTYQTARTLIGIGATLLLTVTPGVASNRQTSSAADAEPASWRSCVRLQSKWLGIAPWHEPKIYTCAIDQLDTTRGEWTTTSGALAVGCSSVIGPADGELFRITTTTGEPGP